MLSVMSPSAPIRVVYADDDPLFRTGLVHAMLADSRIDLVAVTVDGMSACRAITEHRPDVAIVSVGLSGLGGFEIADAARDADLPTQITVIGDVPAQMPSDAARATNVRAVLDRALPREELLGQVAKIGVPVRVVAA